MALCRIQGMDASTAEHPADVLKCQAELRNGYPAYVLHPSTTLRALRQIAGRTYASSTL